MDHEILLGKLHRYGIRGLPLSLIDSYLTNGSQHEKISTAVSGYRSISVGVPKGSIRGPDQLAGGRGASVSACADLTNQLHCCWVDPAYAWKKH